MRILFLNPLSPMSNTFVEVETAFNIKFKNTLLVISDISHRKPPTINHLDKMTLEFNGLK